MKNIISFFVLILLISFSSQSQTIIEIQGGANIANLSDPGNLVDGGVWKSRIGFVGGSATVFNLTDKLIINPGIRYVQKGTKSEWTSSITGKVKATLTNNYLELPIYFKYEFANIGSQLFVIGGPSFAYLISSTTEGDMQLLGHSSVDSKKYYKSYDITFDLGFSSTTPMYKQISFLASAMYSFGFVKVSKLGSKEATRDVKILLGLSYML
jgi:hypothetical protein